MRRGWSTRLSPPPWAVPIASGRLAGARRTRARARSLSPGAACSRSRSPGRCSLRSSHRRPRSYACPWSPWEWRRCEGSYEVLGRARGGRGGRCHGIDCGVAVFVDQWKSYLVYALGLLKVRAQGGEPRVRGLGFEELLLVLLSLTLLLLRSLLFHLLRYGLI